jgi:hypothetical protein
MAVQLNSEKKTVAQILNEDLRMKDVSAKKVPQQLTDGKNNGALMCF